MPQDRTFLLAAAVLQGCILKRSELGFRAQDARSVFSNDFLTPEP